MRAIPDVNDAYSYQIQKNKKRSLEKTREKVSKNFALVGLQGYCNTWRGKKNERRGWGKEIKSKTRNGWKGWCHRESRHQDKIIDHYHRMLFEIYVVEAFWKLGKWFTQEFMQERSHRKNWNHSYTVFISGPFSLFPFHFQSWKSNASEK